MTATARAGRAALTVVVAAAIGLAMILLSPARASAAGGIEIDLGAGFTTSPVGSLLSGGNLAPGGSGISGIMGVRNPSNAAAELSLQLTNVTDYENGCSPDEAAVDTTGCGDPGAGEGDLLNALVFTVEEGDAAAGPFTQTWTGGAAALAGAIATDVGVSIPATSDRWVRVTASLPGGVGDETQGDTMNFGVRVGLDGQGAVVLGAAGGGAALPTSSSATTTPPAPQSSASSTGSGTSTSGAVAGVSTSRGASSGHSGQSAGGQGLASTGVNIALLSMIGALLVLCGFLLLQRRRGAREH
jgi:hypothetical protein